jgi:hypothetical protein
LEKRCRGMGVLKEIIGPRMADSGTHRPGQGYCDTATKPGLQGSAVLYSIMITIQTSA